MQKAVSLMSFFHSFEWFELNSIRTILVNDCDFSNNHKDLLKPLFLIEHLALNHI